MAVSSNVGRPTEFFYLSDPVPVPARVPLRFRHHEERSDIQHKYSNRRGDVWDFDRLLVASTV
jgi:hypothetical protein